MLVFIATAGPFKANPTMGFLKYTSVGSYSMRYEWCQVSKESAYKKYLISVGKNLSCPAGVTDPDSHFIVYVYLFNINGSEKMLFLVSGSENNEGQLIMAENFDIEKIDNWLDGEIPSMQLFLLDNKWSTHEEMVAKADPDMFASKYRTIIEQQKLQNEILSSNLNAMAICFGIFILAAVWYAVLNMKKKPPKQSKVDAKT